MTVFMFFFSACKKDVFITASDARLYTTADTLKFDTVFTTVGSITKSFKIINDNNQKLLISSIKLMGGTNSFYTININGLLSNIASNIELNPNDSIYVFATVNINPNASNLPFVVTDSIQINFNGNTRYVQLEAHGQNAHFLNDQNIVSNTTFLADLPYVISGRLKIDSNTTLTLQPGVKIYCRSNAPVIVNGTLIANGTYSEPIVFRGDRLDEDYNNLPASWPGIYFKESSKNNSLQFVQVRNAYQAMVLEGFSSNVTPKVTLQQCIIDNAYDAGIFCINSSLNANNCLISNCGANINIQLGGSYQFVNCTVPAYSAFFPHKKPVLTINNAALLGNTPVYADLNANFINCIFWAENSVVKDEIMIDRQGTTLFTAQFNHCIYKNEITPLEGTFTNCIVNTDPVFDSIDVRNNYFDFRTNNSLAPGVNAGTITGFPRDLDNRTRANGITDIGCYEKQ